MPKFWPIVAFLAFLSASDLLAANWAQGDFSDQTPISKAIELALTRFDGMNKPLGEMTTPEIDEFFKTIHDLNLFGRTSDFDWEKLDHSQFQQLLRDAVSAQVHTLQNIPTDQINARRLSLLVILNRYYLESVRPKGARWNTARTEDVERLAQRIDADLYVRDLAEKYPFLRGSLGIDADQRIKLYKLSVELGGATKNNLLNACIAYGMEIPALRDAPLPLQSPQQATGFEILAAINRGHSGLRHLLLVGRMDSAFSEKSEDLAQIRGMADFVADYLLSLTPSQETRSFIEGLIYEFFWNEAELIRSKQAPKRPENARLSKTRPQAFFINERGENTDWDLRMAEKQQRKDEDRKTLEAKQGIDLLKLIESRQSLFSRSGGQHSENFVRRILDLPFPEHHQRDHQQERGAFEANAELQAAVSRNGFLGKEAAFWDRLRQRGFDFGAFRSDWPAEQDWTTNWDFDRARFSLMGRLRPLPSGEVHLGYVSKSEVKIRQRQLEDLIRHAETEYLVLDESERALFLEALQKLRRHAQSEDLGILLRAMDDLNRRLNSLRKVEELPIQEIQAMDLIARTRDHFSKWVLKSLGQSFEWPKALKNFGTDVENRGESLVVEFQNLGFSKLPKKIWHFSRAGKFEMRVNLKMTRPDGDLQKILGFDFEVPSDLERTEGVIKTKEFRESLAKALQLQERLFLESLRRLRPSAEEVYSDAQLYVMRTAIESIAADRLSDSEYRKAVYPEGADEISRQVLRDLPPDSPLGHIFLTLGDYAVRKRGLKVQIVFKSLGFRAGHESGSLLPGVLDIEVNVLMADSADKTENILQTSIAVNSSSQEIAVAMREEDVRSALFRKVGSKLPEARSRVASETDPDLAFEEIRPLLLRSLGRPDVGASHSNFLPPCPRALKALSE